jgi:hypothetical protein
MVQIFLRYIMNLQLRLHLTQVPVIQNLQMQPNIGIVKQSLQLMVIIGIMKQMVKF